MVCVDGQTLANVPVVAHPMPLAQVPQSSVPPQPLPITPQYWPPFGVQESGVQLAAVAPQTPVMPPPPQVSAPEQAPQSSVPPQPSPIEPQYCAPPPALQVAGTQPDFTQTPPLQVCPLGQSPQATEPPQLSPIVPQYCADPAVQVSFTQFGPPRQIPWLPQVWSPGQAPQLIEPPGQPFPIVPQYSPPAGVQVTFGVQAAASPEPPLPVTTVLPPVPVALLPPLPVGWSLPASTPVVPPFPPVAEPLLFTPAVHPNEQQRAERDGRDHERKRVRSFHVD